MQLRKLRLRYQLICPGSSIWWVSESEFIQSVFLTLKLILFTLNHMPHPLSFDKYDFITGTRLGELWGSPELLTWIKMKRTRGFPSGSVVKNPPANKGDMDSIPDLGRSHMPWSREPIHHHHWACLLKPRSRNYWAHRLQQLKPADSSAHALQQEKPLQWEAHTPQLERSTRSPQLERSA